MILPSGTYATMLIRELTKSSTDQNAQREIQSKLEADGTIKIKAEIDEGVGEFGVPLEEVLKREGREKLGVPRCIHILSEWLAQNELKTEGLFRISGEKASLVALKSKIDQQEVNEVELKKILSVHDASTVFKNYFSELPEPLLTFQLYPEFVSIQKNNMLSKEEEKNSKIFTTNNNKQRKQQTGRRKQKQKQKSIVSRFKESMNRIMSFENCITSLHPSSFGLL